MRKITFLVILLVFLSSVTYAQAVVPDAVYIQADKAMAENGAPKLPVLLSVNSNKDWMPRLEAYVLKRARQLVIENQLDQASKISLHLIDNNIDNIQALELYQSIRTAITKNEQESKKVAEKEALESHKQQVSETKIKQDLAKTYKTVTNTSSGKKIYLDQDFNSSYRKITWDVQLGLANASWILDDSENLVKYGVSAGASLLYRGESFIGGVEIDGHGLIVSLFGDPSINWGSQVIGTVTAVGLSKYLALRGGYAVFGAEYGEQDKERFFFPTPVVGLGFQDIKIGETGRLKTGIDYYAGHLYADNIDVALGFHLMVSSVMAELSDFDIHFCTGLRDSFMIRNGAMVNDVRLILAIGIGDYE